MEIKYTIEILTKDIQDIEKLVGNIGNSKEASAIELDLALSKLRNVYEILTLSSTCPKPVSKPSQDPRPTQRNPKAPREPFGQLTSQVGSLANRKLRNRRTIRLSRSTLLTRHGSLHWSRVIRNDRAPEGGGGVARSALQ